MKGIILAGGTGSRLSPITKAFSKHLLPIYDKPMIYYSLSTLMLIGIRDVMIISTSRDLPLFRSLLGHGEHLGIHIHYAVQEQARGIAEAFLIAEDFIANDTVTLILGDNIFYLNNFTYTMAPCTSFSEGAMIFTCRVKDPERFGIAEIADDGSILSLEEKPRHPKSHWAVTGLYIYDQHVASYTKALTPSARGELEITDLNRLYLERNALRSINLGRGTAWFDAGTTDSLHEATQFIHAIENRQGLKIGCIEEIALLLGYISSAQLESLLKTYPQSPYRDYLHDLMRHEVGAH